MLLLSTRNAANVIDSLSAVLKGISDDGGLFVPSSFPMLSVSQIEAMAGKRYTEVATEILSMYFDIDTDKLAVMVDNAYASFDTPEVVPIVKLGSREYVMELFHGPTLAFKDIALQMLPRLMSEAMKINNISEDVLVLTATSGDTGKAALEGFKDVPRTKIAVFYPEQGVSDMQKLQMVTTEGNNTFVAAVRGNFDDAQTAVKEVFGSAEQNHRLKKMGYLMSSANSINFGRLAPQIVYYFYGYAQLINNSVIKPGASINICVPTGNFGDILAAYYAKRMGLPVHRLICASNKNNVLTDFFDSGTYFANRQFFRTISPSMDILISSNLERLVFEELGRDSMRTASCMRELKTAGSYSIADNVQKRMSDDFYADFCDDNSTLGTIRRVYNRDGYVMDTHTAVAQSVYEKYIGHTDDPTPTLLVSTASPYKFAQNVLKAVSGETVDDAFKAARRLSEVTGLPIPPAISSLKEKPVRFTNVYDKNELADAVTGCAGDRR